MASQPAAHILPRTEDDETLTRTLLGTTAAVAVFASDTRVGVHRQGGLGKSVLAASVAASESVRRAFPDDTFWIPIGQQPRLTSLQAELVAHLGDRPVYDVVYAGERDLRKRLADKACLVVLDDVWQLPHAKTFEVLSRQSRLLITTRDRSLLTALGARHAPRRLAPGHGDGPVG